MLAVWQALLGYLKGLNSQRNCLAQRSNLFWLLDSPQFTQLTETRLY